MDKKQGVVLEPEPFQPFQHPTYEIPAGGPRPEVTAAKSQALHDQLSTCRTLANSASKDQDDALKAKNAALRNSADSSSPWSMNCNCASPTTTPAGRSLA
ncbi:MAG: hypothetical protein NTV80_08640 [Verrucomicrobia bacterium]|nr:hypothetical protein [Verrucomicrobiota bacterium]